MIKIYDNFLEEEEFILIKDNIIFQSAWNLRCKVRKSRKLSEEEIYGRWIDKKAEIEFNNWQFTLMMKHPKVESPEQADSFKKINTLTRKIDTISWIKVRATLNYVTKEQILLGGFHNDIPKKYFEQPIVTCLYYLNTNNGYTEFEDGRKIESVANRLAIFPAEFRHSGVSCTDELFRAQINLNCIAPVEIKASTNTSIQTLE